MNHSITKPAIREQFLDNFPENAQQLFPGTAQQEAREALEHLDVPTTRDEYWKYTRLGAVLKREYRMQPHTLSEEHVAAHTIPGLDAIQLVFVNGYFAAELSASNLPEGLSITPWSLADDAVRTEAAAQFGKLAPTREQLFPALNTAFGTDGIFLQVASGTVLEQPIELLHLSDGHGVLTQPRNLLVFGRHSEATIIERFEGAQSNAGLTNALSEMTVAEGSKVDYYLTQHQGVADAHIQTIEASQAANSHLSLHAVTLQGQLVRNNLNIRHEGSGIETYLTGLYLTRDKQHVDNHTFVDHAQPHCYSNELYKGIMNDRSTGVFNGKVMVRQDAQKTNAFQSNQNILLTDHASINSKPELEIYADDVKCSHGSTTGQLDEEAIFYLRSRGISKDRARKLMIQAFAADVLERIRPEALRTQIEEHITLRYANNS